MTIDDQLADARGLASAGDHAGAARLLAKLARKNLGPRAFEVHDNWLLAAIKAEDWKAATAIAAKLLEHAVADDRGDTVYAVILNRKAIAHQKLGDLDTALVEVDRGIGYRDDLGELHYERACILSLRGDLDQAAASVKVALRHDRSQLAAMKLDDDLVALRGHPALGALFGGKGKKPRLPKVLPSKVAGAFELFDSLEIKLRKPGRASAVVEKLPKPLREFYARAARLPTASNDSIVAAGSLASEARSFARTLAAEEDGLEEGLPRHAFSATKDLVAVGSSDNGGSYFLDPKRYGEIVFELAHDETELRAETATFGAFVAREGLRTWASDNHLDDDFFKLQEKARREAKRAHKVLAAKLPRPKARARADDGRGPARTPSRGGVFASGGGAEPADAGPSRAPGSAGVRGASGPRTAGR
jgi:tetratricopeptide (TPR) repeat protein